MKTLVMILAGLLGAGSAAAAQESLALDSDPFPGREEEVAAGLPPLGSFEPVDLPRSLSAVPASERAPEPLAETEYRPFSVGVAGGYLSAKNTDHGTWTVGVQARLRLGLLAMEASIQFHENVYEHGDIVVSQIPVQLTAFLYILPVGPIRPYILGGVGWYYTRFDYTGAFASIPNRSEHIFGEHLGAGGELFFSPAVSIDVDVRYIFLNPTTDEVLGQQFNYWQTTAGLNFFF